jgi:hypothetical protein
VIRADVHDTAAGRYIVRDALQARDNLSFMRALSIINDKLAG